MFVLLLALLQVFAAVVRHVDWGIVKCLVIAGPGFAKDSFKTYLDAEAVKRDVRPLIEHKASIFTAPVRTGGAGLDGDPGRCGLCVCSAVLCHAWSAPFFLHSSPIPQRPCWCLQFSVPLTGAQLPPNQRFLTSIAARLCLSCCVCCPRRQVRTSTP
jgi:hypothetical protein